MSSSSPSLFALHLSYAAVGFVLREGIHFNYQFHLPLRKLGKFASRVPIFPIPPTSSAVRIKGLTGINPLYGGTLSSPLRSVFYDLYYDALGKNIHSGRGRGIAETKPFLSPLRLSRELSFTNAVDSLRK